MTEQRSESVGTCPTWCRVGVAADPEGPGHAGDLGHAHVSVDVEVGDGADPMVARMVQLAGSGVVRVVVGQQVVGVEEARAFAHALLRLASSAQLAEPGLGFVEVFAAQANLSTGEMALAAALDVERLRAQRAGGRVLDQREFDRLALAVAQLVPLKLAAAGTDEVDAAQVADLTELASLADGQPEG